MRKTYFEQMRELMENSENWALFIPDLFDMADKHIERLEAENDRLRRISRVYIVISSRGEYSDYEEYIEKVFLSRQEAVEWIESRGVTAELADGELKILERWEEPTGGQVTIFPMPADDGWIFESERKEVEYWRYSVDERPVFCRYHTLDYSLVEMEVG